MSGPSAMIAWTDKRLTYTNRSPEAKKKVASLIGVALVSETCQARNLQAELQSPRKINQVSSQRESFCIMLQKMC